MPVTGSMFVRFGAGTRGGRARTWDTALPHRYAALLSASVRISSVSRALSAENSGDVLIV